MFHQSGDKVGHPKQSWWWFEFGECYPRDSFSFSSLFLTSTPSPARQPATHIELPKLTWYICVFQEFLSSKETVSKVFLFAASAAIIVPKQWFWCFVEPVRNKDYSRYLWWWYLRKRRNNIMLSWRKDSFIHRFLPSNPVIFHDTPTFTSPLYSPLHLLMFGLSPNEKLLLMIWYEPQSHTFPAILPVPAYYRDPFATPNGVTVFPLSSVDCEPKFAHHFPFTLFPSLLPHLFPHHQFHALFSHDDRHRVTPQCSPWINVQFFVVILSLALPTKITKKQASHTHTHTRIANANQVVWSRRRNCIDTRPSCILCVCPLFPSSSPNIYHCVGLKREEGDKTLRDQGFETVRGKVSMDAPRGKDKKSNK